MNRRSAVMVMLGLCCGLLCGPPCQGAPPSVSNQDRTAAKSAAEAWLALVDAGDYAASWNKGSSFFQARMSGDKWQQIVAKFRVSLGEMVDRQFVRRSVVNPPFGFPQAKYVRCVYKTRFQKQASVNEVITMVQGSDEGWWMSSYLVIPQQQSAPANPKANPQPEAQSAPAGKITILNRKSQP